MPIRYAIEKERRLVTTELEGHLTFDEVLAHQNELSSDPDFHPEFNELWDATGLTGFALSVAHIRVAVNRKLFSPSSRVLLSLATHSHMG